MKMGSEKKAGHKFVGVKINLLKGKEVSISS